MKPEERERKHLLTVGALVHVLTELVSNLPATNNRRHEIEHKVTTSLNKHLSKHLPLKRGE